MGISTYMEPCWSPCSCLELGTGEHIAQLWGAGRCIVASYLCFSSSVFTLSWSDWILASFMYIPHTDTQSGCTVRVVMQLMWCVWLTVAGLFCRVYLGFMGQECKFYRNQMVTLEIISQIWSVTVHKSETASRPAKPWRYTGANIKTHI